MQNYGEKKMKMKAEKEEKIVKNKTNQPTRSASIAPITYECSHE